MIEYAEIFRMTERLAITLFGGVSVFLGYKLLLSGVLGVASGEWEGLGVRVKLTRASPGIFFVAFGSFILLQTLHATVSVGTTRSLEATSTVNRPTESPTPHAQVPSQGAGNETEPSRPRPLESGQGPSKTIAAPSAQARTSGGTAGVSSAPPAVKAPAAASGISEPAETLTIVKKRQFLGVTNTREWDRTISSVNLAIVALEKSNSIQPVNDLRRLREMVLRAAFGDSDFEFYVLHEGRTTSELSGEDRAKWSALDRRAKRIPVQGGER